MVGQAGRKDDPVVGGGLKVALIGVGDDFNQSDSVGAGTVDSGRFCPPECTADNSRSAPDTGPPPARGPLIH